MFTGVVDSKALGLVEGFVILLLILPGKVRGGKVLCDPDGAEVTCEVPSVIDMIG